MRVAVFVSYLPPHVGGIEVVAENQIKALAANGHEVFVVTSACSSEMGLEKCNGYEVRRIPAWNYFEEKMGAVFPLFSPSLIWHSYKAVKNAELVHAHDAFYLTSLASAFWAKILRKPLVLTQHVDLVPHPNPIVNFAQKAVYATTGKFILRSSSKIIVLNNRVKKFLIRLGIEENKIIFLPNGVDTKIFKPVTIRQKRDLRKKYNLPQDKTLALFVGRFVPKKGFTKLQQIAPIKNLEVVFAGGFQPAGHTRQDHYFLGPVSRDQCPDIFKMCDIFVLPSEGEGFPVTVQEAMASGLAVITTDDPAYSLYNFTEKHLILTDPTIHQVSKSLTQLTDSTGKRTRLGHNARLYAQNNFSWDRNILDLTQLYKEALL